jgi:hypothetical protein
MENIEIVSVQSSAISSIAWDNTNQQLLIKFKDSPFYAYPSADRQLFEAFKASPSKGKFFKANIEKNHKNFVVLNN